MEIYCRNSFPGVILNYLIYFFSLELDANTHQFPMMEVC